MTQRITPPSHLPVALEDFRSMLKGDSLALSLGGEVYQAVLFHSATAAGIFVTVSEPAGEQFTVGEKLKVTLDTLYFKTYQ